MNDLAQRPGATPREGMPIMNFTSSIGLYALVGDKNSMADQISARIFQLEAMLAVTYGDLGVAFHDGLTDETKSNYMWCCHTIASEIRELYWEMKTGGSA